jgi:beta-lactamase regulating signal transducer with metallopeptidase domain
MLLPICVVDKLSASKRSALLLHELIHLQRGDHWVRILELTVGVAFWWLPIVRVIGSQLRTCEETSCDAAVVARLPHARRAYAELLLDVVDFTGHLPPKAVAHATAMSAANRLELRLRAIIEPPQEAPRKWRACSVAVCVACVILPLQVQIGFGGPMDFVARPVQSATSPKAGSATDAASPTRGELDGNPLAAYCCPS